MKNVSIIFALVVAAMPCVQQVMAQCPSEVAHVLTGSFNYFGSIHVDDEGNVLVADSGVPWMYSPSGSRIRRLLSVSAIMGPGSCDVFAVDSSDTIYACHGSTLIKWAPDGDTPLYWGYNEQAEELELDDLGNLYVRRNSDVVVRNKSNMSVVRSFTLPMFVLDFDIGPDGLLYLADTMNGRVVVTTPDGAVVREWGMPGQGDGQFDVPLGISCSTAGIVFVGDAGNRRIQAFSLQGEYLCQWSDDSNPLGAFIAADPAGPVYAFRITVSAVAKFVEPVVLIEARSWGDVKVLFR